MDKFFSLYSQRVEILRHRNMNIPNSSEQKEILKRYSYYNIINGYKDPFLFHGSSKVEKYKDGTQLSELEALLTFDTNIRLIFLKEILKIEEIIKNQIVQSFYTYHLDPKSNNTSMQQNNLHRDSEYLRSTYYTLDASYSVYSINNFGIVSTSISNSKPNVQSTKLDRQVAYNKFVKTANQTIHQQKKNKNLSITSYLNQHGYIPMWILMNVLTLGNVSHLFTFQKEAIQLHMIKSLKLHSSPNMSNNLTILNTARSLQILSIFRNICAHNERFYNTQVKVPIDDIFMQFGLKLPHSVDPSSNRRLNKSKSNQRLNARRGIFSLIFVISLFLRKNDLNHFIEEIQKEFLVLDEKLHTISIVEIKRLMGLNFEWIDSIMHDH